MKDEVIVKAFAGSVQVSCRRFSLTDYYDANLQEIDNADFIIRHKISRVEQHFYSDREYILRINYYNAQGIPYRFDEIKTGGRHNDSGKDRSHK